MSKKATLQPLIEAGITISIMGSVPIVIRYVSANAYTIGIFRLFVTIVLFSLWIVIKERKDLVNLKIRDWFKLVLLGLIFGLHWISFFWSIKLASASIGVIGVSTYGIHLVGISNFIGHVKPKLIDYLIVVVAVIGSLLVVPEFSFDNQATIGLCLAIVSGLLFALLPFIHQGNSHIPSSIRAYGQFLFAFPVFMFFIPKFQWELPALDWYGMLYLAIFGTIISHTLWIRVTTALSTTTSSVIYYAAIPITLLFSNIILDEPITFYLIIGAALIIISNIIGLLLQIRRKTLFVTVKKSQIKDFTIE